MKCDQVSLILRFYDATRLLSPSPKVPPQAQTARRLPPRSRVLRFLAPPGTSKNDGFSVVVASEAPWSPSQVPRRPPRGFPEVSGAPRRPPGATLEPFGLDFGPPGTSKIVLPPTREHDFQKIWSSRRTVQKDVQKCLPDAPGRPK